jgi:signal transduction histidine kinase
MKESILIQLQKVANAALSSSSTQEGMKHLARAFALFSTETNSIKAAYLRLQQRSNEINKELDLSKNHLKLKRQDLESITTFLDNLLDIISQAVIFIDINGTIVIFNKKAQDLFQKEKKDVLFHNYLSHFKDDFLGFSVKQSINLNLSKQKSYATLKLKDKNAKQIEISTLFVGENHLPYKGLIILINDITKIKELKIKASRNDHLKELGKMNATIAHEIKNPLGGIRGYASLLIKNLENNPHLQQMAIQILESSKSLERLVSSILHFSRPLEIKPTKIDLFPMLKDLCKSIKVDPSFDKNIKITFHKIEKKLSLYADRQLLNMAFLNLIVNAYQAIDKRNGEITISILKNGNFVLISITDTGKGIEERNIDKIFSPFFTTKQRGNGLGLSEAYKIIQTHGGNIDVHSNLDKGTSFIITLPIKE